MADTSDVLRGHIDMIVLAKLAQQGDGYGYRINRDIQAQAAPKFELKEATLYSAFRRMEKEGLICSYWGDEEAGARRRYYTITDDGKVALKAYLNAWKELKTVVDGLVAEKGAPTAKPKTAAKPKTTRTAPKTTSKARGSK